MNVAGKDRQKWQHIHQTSVPPFIRAPADDEQSVASARRQRRQDGEDRRDEDAEAEDELPSEALRQHPSRDLSDDIAPEECAQDGALLLAVPDERAILAREAVVGRV